VTGADRRLAQVRLSEDAGEADKDSLEDSYVLTHYSGTDEEQLNVMNSPVAGFMMAIRDPIVLIFAVMGIAQFLGQSFANFFPTCVASSIFRGFSDSRSHRLTQTLKFDTTITLLLAA
jgi:hypothetical protein